MSENARQPCQYKCLRCGHEYDGTWIPGVMEELSCPECESNSQRRLKKPAKKQEEAGAKA